MITLLHKLKHARFLRIVLARPRLLICAAIGIAIFILLPQEFARHTTTRLIIAWNVGAYLYLALAIRMMFWSSHERMKTRALQHDEGRLTVLFFVVLAAAMSIGAIVAELSNVKEVQGSLRYLHITLIHHDSSPTVAAPESVRVLVLVLVRLRLAAL